MKRIFLMFFLLSGFASATPCGIAIQKKLDDVFVNSEPRDNPGSYKIISITHVDLPEESLYLKTVVLLAGNAQIGAPRNTYWYSLQIVCTDRTNEVWYEGEPTLKALSKYRGG